MTFTVKGKKTEKHTKPYAFKDIETEQENNFRCFINTHHVEEEYPFE